jgi:hypothetical protein
MRHDDRRYRDRWRIEAAFARHESGSLSQGKPMSSTGSDLRTRDTGRDMSCSVICEAFLWGRDCDA